MLNVKTTKLNFPPFNPGSLTRRFNPGRLNTSFRSPKSWLSSSKKPRQRVAATMPATHWKKVSRQKVQNSLDAMPFDRV